MALSLCPLSQIWRSRLTNLNEVEAVQHVYLTNIPVWFGLLGDI